MMAELTIFLIGLLLLIVVVLIVIRVRCKYNYFLQANIPGPAPKFLLGNFDILWRTRSYFRQLEVWTRQYGKIYGIFEGTLPIYVVSDVDFLEDVFIKQFRNFDTRKPLLFTLPDHKRGMHLSNASGPEWRRQRRVINPIFSKAKIMSMLPLINGCVNELLHILTSYADRNIDVDVRPIYTRLMMDVVCQSAFSLKMDVQRNPENAYLKKLNMHFAVDNRKWWFVKMAAVLPWFVGTFIFRLIYRLNVLFFKLSKTFSFIESNELPFLWLLSRIGEHVAHVRHQLHQSRRVDLLSLMLNAQTEHYILDVKEHNDDQSMNVALQTSPLTVSKLTYGEIMRNVLLFIFAGSESPSATMSYCVYVLATHQDVQQKLREEIESNFDDNDQSFIGGDIEKLLYLDMFIKEVSRMYPVAPLTVNRLCVQDTTIGKHRIQKGQIKEYRG